MKILFDHQIFSYQKYGGISRYYFELMNQFQKSELVTFDLALKYSENVYLEKLAALNVIDLFRSLSISTKLRFLARYAFNRRISNRHLKQNNFDLFHPTFFDPSFFTALNKRPYVVTLMDMTPELFPQLFPRFGFYGRFVTSRWIEGKRRIAENAVRIIAISNHTKNDVIHFYNIDPSKIDVIYLASSLNLKTDIESVKSLSDPPFLLYVGSRFGYKNFDGFANAVMPLLQRDRDLRVTCVGGGPFVLEEQSLLEDLGVRDRFIQSDASDDQLVLLYKAACAFVFPSRYEGFGIPIVEAFSCGCPCAISRSSCFPEIAGDAAAYFDPDDVESMTETLRQVVYDEGLRRKLIANGFERAKLFSWEKTATQTLAVYEKACAELPFGATS